MTDGTLTVRRYRPDDEQAVNRLHAAAMRDAGEGLTLRLYRKRLGC